MVRSSGGPYVCPGPECVELTRGTGYTPAEALAGAGKALDLAEVHALRAGPERLPHVRLLHLARPLRLPRGRQEPALDVRGRHREWLAPAILVRADLAPPTRTRTTARSRPTGPKPYPATSTRTAPAAAASPASSVSSRAPTAASVAPKTCADSPRSGFFGRVHAVKPSVDPRVSRTKSSSESSTSSKSASDSDSRLGLRLDLLLLLAVRLRELVLRELRQAALADRALVHEVAERVHVAQCLELGERLDLDLTDAFTGQVHDRAHVFERGATAVGDVERARLGELPRPRGRGNSA